MHDCLTQHWMNLRVLAKERKQTTNKDSHCLGGGGRLGCIVADSGRDWNVFTVSNHHLALA